MKVNNSVEVEFVAPEAQITLEGNCVHDNTGTFKILTLPYEDCVQDGDMQFAAFDRRRSEC